MGALGATPPARPFLSFVRSETFGGVILMIGATAAFGWANSPWSAAYFELLQVPIDLGVGDWRLEKSLLHFVNDFLMAIFFLMVGLEIKREFLVGELSNPRARWLPVAAALGGMIVPAGAYALFNAGGEGSAGWGIPMATDIAFALGVLALLGSRVPLGLKVFLTALAIVDDLGAVVVIAVFYTEQIGWGSLALSLAATGAAAIYGLFGGRRGGLYLAIGLVAWYFMLKSGVHATVAGVMIAMTLPMAPELDKIALRRQLQELFGANQPLDDAQADFHVLSRLVNRAQSPLHEVEHALQPWVAYLIVPVFAFLNAGFTLDALEPTAAVSLGAFAGLLLGKPLGICGAAWLVVRFGWAALPERTNWPIMIGAGLLGGIGFTMSLFVSVLAFGEGALDAQAKLGVFAASLLAAGAGLLLLHRVLGPRLDQRSTNELGPPSSSG